MLEWIVQLVILSSMHPTIALRKLTIFWLRVFQAVPKITIADQHYLNTSEHTHLELISVRQNYISQIESILSVNNPVVTINAVINNRDLLTQLILDCTSATVAINVNLSPEDCHNVETVSRHLCFALHLKRCKLMDQPV